MVQYIQYTTHIKAHTHTPHTHTHTHTPHTHTHTSICTYEKLVFLIYYKGLDTRANTTSTWRKLSFYSMNVTVSFFSFILLAEQQLGNEPFGKPGQIPVLLASETLSGLTQLKIGDVCVFIYVWMYVCHFVL